MFCFIIVILHFETSHFLLNEPDVVSAESSPGLSSANDVNQEIHDGDNQQDSTEYNPPCVKQRCRIARLSRLHIFAHSNSFGLGLMVILGGYFVKK